LVFHLVRFAAHFEPVNGGFVFRKDRGAQGVMVTAQERDRAVNQFLLWTTVLLVVSVVVATIGMVILSIVNVLTHSHSDWANWVWIAVSGTAFGSIYLWLWNAPAKVFAGRPPVN
jgi:hypothetical protein